jgi:hypothetical protein
MFARILASLLVVGSAAMAADDNKPTVEPKNAPLELSITGKAVKYELDTGGLSSDDYKKKIEDSGKKGGGRPPAAPKVDLTLEVKNTSNKTVTIWAGGDPVVIDFVLKGKGAVSISPLVAVTREFRLPVAKEIEVGKSISIPVKSLAGGFRGVSQLNYWTAPGEYELTAKLRTGLSPIPEGAKGFMDGFCEVKLTSAPLKITVEEKK